MRCIEEELAGDAQRLDLKLCGNSLVADIFLRRGVGFFKVSYLAPRLRAEVRADLAGHARALRRVGPVAEGDMNVVVLFLRLVAVDPLPSPYVGEVGLNQAGLHPDDLAF